MVWHVNITKMLPDGSRQQFGEIAVDNIFQNGNPGFRLRILCLIYLIPIVLRYILPIFLFRVG